MTTTKKTCGPMYKEGLEKYGDSPEKMRAFAAGFVSGQAEKVYLGACRAAMFRPSQDRSGMIEEIIKDVCSRYGLGTIYPVGTENEFWICRLEWADDVELLRVITENSPQWHAHRAYLCGVPESEIDYEFHLRAGHGKRCD